MCSLKQRLNYLRGLNKVTVKKLVTHLNITPQTYYSYESGKAVPSLNRLIKLADFYSVSVDYILGRSDDIIFDSEEHSKLTKQLINSGIRIDQLKIILELIQQLRL